MPRITPQPSSAPAIPTPLRLTGAIIPNRLYVLAPGMTKHQTRTLAQHAVAISQTLSPRLSGRAANGIKEYYGDGFFGVRWSAPYLWYQEGGHGAFTMRTLAGKTIPMWVDDWTGEMARADPKAKTRITQNGRRQILIFRRAGKLGARKRVAVRDRQGRLVRWRSVPQSYPGAPGRITHREWKSPEGTTGRITRTVTPSHVGVRWRHPGLIPREFMQHALQQVALLYEIENTEVYATYSRQ